MRTIPFNIITLEKLETLKACKDTIRFFKRNFIEGFELNIDQIDGDYKDFVDWVKEDNIEFCFDDRGNCVKENYYDDILL